MRISRLASCKRSQDRVKKLLPLARVGRDEHESPGCHARGQLSQELLRVGRIIYRSCGLFERRRSG